MWQQNATNFQGRNPTGDVSQVNFGIARRAGRSKTEGGYLQQTWQGANYESSASRPQAEGNREMWPPPALSASSRKTVASVSDAGRSNQALSTYHASSHGQGNSTPSIYKQANSSVSTQGNREMWPPPPVTTTSKDTSRGNQEMWPPPPLSATSRSKTSGFLADGQCPSQGYQEMRPPTSSRKTVGFLADDCSPELDRRGLQNSARSACPQLHSAPSNGSSSASMMQGNPEMWPPPPPSSSSRKTVVASSMCRTSSADIAASRPRSKTDGYVPNTQLAFSGHQGEDAPKESQQVKERSIAAKSRRTIVSFQPDDLTEELAPVTSLEESLAPDNTAKNLLDELQACQQENADLRVALELAEKASATTSMAYREFGLAEEEQASRGRETEEACIQEVREVVQRLEMMDEHRYSDRNMESRLEELESRLESSHMETLAARRRLEASNAGLAFGKTRYEALQMELLAEKEKVQRLGKNLSMAQVWGSANTATEEELEEMKDVVRDLRQQLAAEERIGKLRTESDAEKNTSENIDAHLLSQQLHDALHQLSITRETSAEEAEALEAQGLQLEAMRRNFEMSQAELLELLPRNSKGVEEISKHDKGVQTVDQFVMSMGGSDENAPTSLAMSDSGFDTTQNTCSEYLLSGAGDPLEEPPVSEFWEIPDAPGIEAFNALPWEHKQLYDSLEQRFRRGRRRQALPTNDLPPGSHLELLRRSYLTDPDYMRKIVAELFYKHDTNNHGYLSWRSGEANAFLADFFALHDFPPPRLPTVVFSSIFNQVKMESGRKEIKGLNIEEMCQFATRVYDFIYKDLRGEMNQIKALQSARSFVDDDLRSEDVIKEVVKEVAQRPQLRRPKTFA